MDELRSLDKDSRGVLSIIDGMIFCMIVFITTLFIFQAFGGALTEEKDLRSTEFRREAVQDIQDTALASIIEETGITNQSDHPNVTVQYDNITVERAVKEYLYLYQKDEGHENISYDLSRLENDIEEVYRICAHEVSRYHFAVEASYNQSKLLISDVTGIDFVDELPSDRGATTSTATIGQEQMNITLYIWR